MNHAETVIKLLDILITAGVKAISCSILPRLNQALLGSAWIQTRRDRDRDSCGSNEVIGIYENENIAQDIWMT